MHAKKLVLNCCSERKAVEKIVDVVEGTSRIGDVFTKPSSAFFTEPTESVQRCVLVTSAEEGDVLRETNFEGH